MRCLFSDFLFNLADNVQHLARNFLSLTISFQILIFCKLAGLLPDCALDFMKLACCRVFCALSGHRILLNRLCSPLRKTSNSPHCFVHHPKSTP